jgi:hypothetical protein
VFGGAVPAHDSLNPGRPMRFDAHAAIRRLRRVVIIAPAFAVLLALGAAGAASAADGLDLSKALPTTPVVPTIDPTGSVETVKTALTPVTAVVKPVTHRAVQAANRVVQSESAQVAVAIVRGARDEAEGVVRSVPPVAVPPVAIPPVALPDVSLEPLRGLPRHAIARAAAVVTPQAAPASQITTVASGDASSTSATVAPPATGSLLPGPTRPTLPALPLGPFGATTDVAFGGSGAGQGPWLSNASPPPVPFAWLSSLRFATPFAMPGGLTPRSLVPPG